jgi:hypothetical protein
MMNRVLLSVAAFGLLVSAGCAGDEPSTSQTDEALTAEQCTYFAEGDTVTICHHTSSLRKPYTIIRTNAAGCASGHTGHAGDYVASTDPSSPIYDPTCSGQGCLPAGAPSDGTIECCEGLASVGGTCTDIDECATGTDNCSDNASCTNTVGSFSCACNAGYSGDGVTCTDIDECATDTDNCSANASCTNTPGSFSCACNAGYSGDGVTCTDIDECASDTDNCSTNASCTNTPGSFSCACNAGYSGDGVTCTDIDECASDTDNCSANAGCTNTPGSFSCACNAGYSGDGVTCSDVDECATANGGCSTNASCTNTAGGYTCTCNAGYSGDGYTCASNAPVTQYYGTRIGAVEGFATFTVFGYSSSAYTEGQMQFWMYGEDATGYYSGCNGDGYAYYSNGGGYAATRVTRTNGAEFGSLEFVAGDGWGQCYNYGYVELYKAGVLQGAFDIEGQANSTVYGFTGSFDEARVAFYYNAAQRNTHSFTTYNAGLIDHVTFGSP